MSTNTIDSPKNAYLQPAGWLSLRRYLCLCQTKPLAAHWGTGEEPADAHYLAVRSVSHADIWPEFKPV